MDSGVPCVHRGSGDRRVKVEQQEASLRNSGGAGDSGRLPSSFSASLSSPNPKEMVQG